MAGFFKEKLACDFISCLQIKRLNSNQCFNFFPPKANRISSFHSKNLLRMKTKASPIKDHSESTQGSLKNSYGYFFRD